MPEVFPEIVAVPVHDGEGNEGTVAAGEGPRRGSMAMLVERV